MTREAKIGDVLSCKGQGWDIYTLRGWVHCDDRADLREERNELESFFKKLKKGEKHAHTQKI